MSLIDIALFEPVFSQFANRRVGYVSLDGNVGDRIIDAAASQLMDDFGVNHRTISHRELDSGTLHWPVDAILVSGGGNMGSLYPVTASQRNKALALGQPVTVLPQSFTDSAEDIRRFHHVFARERHSLRMAIGTTLAPDLALGLRRPWIDEGVEAKVGVWLREDRERRAAHSSLSLGDPASVSATVDDYVGLASRFERIITDRLHFAIAGLLLGRKVDLLPNSYHKNRSMYETWLRSVGCRWRTEVGKACRDADAVRASLWRRLSAPPSALVPWVEQPSLNQSWTLVSSDEGAGLRSGHGEHIGLNTTAALIVALCDGTWMVEDIALALAEQFGQEIVGVASQVQKVLRLLLDRGALELAVDNGRVDSPGLFPPRSSRRIEIEVLPPRKVRGRFRWCARVRNTAGGDFVQYFDCDWRWRDTITPRADPFVLAVLPRAMREGSCVRVVGAPVDLRLLENLDEYQHAWCAWRPRSVRAVAVEAEEESVAQDHSRAAVMSFSGGVDSSYTLFRHCVEPDGRRNRDLTAAVFASGFDISVNDRRAYAAAADRLRTVAEDAGVELIEVATNIRTCLVDWEIEHGAALATILHLFAGRFRAGLVASTAPYVSLFPWGSNPVTDRLLGGAFEIVHDSAGVMRLEKLRALARWPRGIRRLRVCWMNRDASENCGRCIKCYHLAMGLAALNAPMDCFAVPPRDDAIANYVSRAAPGRLEKLEFSDILRAANVACIDQPWLEALSRRFGTGARPADPKDDP